MCATLLNFGSVQLCFYHWVWVCAVYHWGAMPALELLIDNGHYNTSRAL
jgi:hypothetical protein